MLLPQSRHTIFGTNRWSLHYLHASSEFPLGRIGDPSTPANIDRALIERTLGDLGPIVHVALGPHEVHNAVVVLDEIPANHVTHICDAVIVPKGGGQFSVETLLGDCASVIVDGRNCIGFLHVGQAEILGGLIGNFLAKWEKVERILTPKVYIGPALSAQCHPIPDPQPIIDRGCGRYLTPMTVWGTQGFSLVSAIAGQFMEASREGDGIDVIEPENISTAEFCPFTARLAGCDAWASDRFFKERHSGEFSPRDCAFFHFKG